MPASVYPLPPPALPEPPSAPPVLALDAFTYADRSSTVENLSESLVDSGCWLLDRRATSATQLLIVFELGMEAVLDMYATLVATGLELSRATHADLTSMCTLHRHGAASSSVLNARLSVTFLQDVDLPSILSRRFLA